MRWNKRGADRLFATGAATALAAAVVLVCSAHPARAQATERGSVTGTLRAPGPAERGEAELRNEGFRKRARNPLIAPIPYDPLPWVIVVLEPRGELSEEDSTPPRLRPHYDLLDEAFSTPVFPVALKGEIEIKNVGTNAHRLSSPQEPTLLDGDVVNPNGRRKLSLNKPYQVVQVRDPDSAHLIGRLVAFPLHYYAMVNPDGTFQIDEVPAGRWRVRLWYRDGWLKMKPGMIDVAARRAATLTMSLPSKLEIVAPGEETPAPEK